MGTAVFGCSTCGKQFRVLPEQAGHKVRCPHCETPNHVSSKVFEASEPHTEGAGGREGSSGRVEELASLVQEVGEGGARFSSRPAPLTYTPLTYTHSRLAKNTQIVAMIAFVAAVVGILYILVVTDWGLIRIKDAIPIMVVLLTPSAILALVGVLLMGMAHCVEYLARIAAETSR